MWYKYDYVCTHCDALIQITTLDGDTKYYEPNCPCGSNSIIYIGVSDGNAPIIEDVTNITPRTVVKIDSNPYN
jgi:DNA-directed RNA polymerase subunit RPC12/RpoP